MTVVMLSTFTVIGLAVKRQNWKDFPNKARIALVVYSIYAPATFFLFVLHLIRNDWDEELHKTNSRIGSAVGMSIWVSFHWQFTAYYL